MSTQTQDEAASLNPKGVLARNLVRLRHSAGLSQGKLARKVSRGGTFIAVIEEQRHSTRCKNLFVVARALDVAPGDLLKRTPSERPEPWRTPAIAPEEVFARNFAKLRKVAGLTMREVWERSHRRQSYLYALEHARHDPSIDVIFAVAESLGVEPEELVRIP